MPTFDFPTLVWWGLPLAAAPLLIHLINLLRHRRVAFAAVELLMAGQKKYRTRVLLRQLVLLALRTAAIVGLVLAVAQPRWKDAWGGLFGGGRGRHVILVDDSYSMLDRSVSGRLGDANASDRGRDAVARLVADLATAGGPQEIAVGRFSGLARAGADGWDVAIETLTPQTVERIRDALTRHAAGFGDDGPAAPVATAADLFDGDRDVRESLWIVGDLRARDWRPAAARGSGAGPAGDVQATLRRLAAAGVEIRFIDCGPTASEAAGNLTIERLEAVGGVPAVGVLVSFEVVVRNDGPATVRDVQIALREDDVSRPGVTLAEIGPGASVAGRFDCRFTTAGGHRVEAALPADAVAADDVRTVAFDVVDRVEVLVVDGEPKTGRPAGDAFFVTAALAPGLSAVTGLQPRIEPPRALATLDLAAFDSIWLLDCPRLDPAEVAALEAYASGGGGVVFFTGPRTDVDSVNRLLHRGGAGLFPVPLAGAVDLPTVADGMAKSPDVVAEDHPVVAVIAAQRNPLLDAIRVDRFMAVNRNGEGEPPRDAPAPASDPAVRRIASLRSGDPLIVERPFGTGLVAAVLTTAAPTWNSWARGNPSWVVVMLELESRVAAGRRWPTSIPVGGSLVMPLEPGVVAADVEFTLPGGLVVRQPVVADGAGGFEAALPVAERPGGYVARWRNREAAERERSFAVNVNPEEGRLERIDPETLARGLDGLPATVDLAAAVGSDTSRTGAASLARPLLLVLLAILIGEQLMAVLAGYHPAGRSAGAGPSSRSAAAWNRGRPSLDPSSVTG